MARLTFEEYKHQIEVIKSMPHIAAMIDEIIAFANSNEPKILTLFTLREALLKDHSVDETSSGETYDSLDAAYPHFTKDQVPQMIFDLINFEIDQYNEKEYRSTLDTLKKTDPSFTFPSPFDTFSSNFPEAELTRIATLLIEKEFISVESKDDFVYAFSGKPIKKEKRIKWLKTYNGKSNNVALAILLLHISPKETSKHFESVRVKMLNIFDLPGRKITSKRSFETTLQKVREKYKPTPTTSLLNSILNPS